MMTMSNNKNNKCKMTYKMMKNNNNNNNSNKNNNKNKLQIKIHHTAQMYLLKKYSIPINISHSISHYQIYIPSILQIVEALAVLVLIYQIQQTLMVDTEEEEEDICRI